MSTVHNGRTLVTKAEAAEILGVSTRTVERRLASEELRVVERVRQQGRGGRRVMIDLEQVVRHSRGASEDQLQLDL